MNNRIRSILDQADIGEQYTLVSAQGGQRNETWLYGPYVLRLADQQNERSLIQEALLLQYLADAIPVPTVIAYGSDDHGEWMIQEKANGNSLAHDWVTLDEPIRQAVVGELAEIVQAMHQLPCDTVSILRLPSNWLTATLPSAVKAIAEASKSHRYVESALMDDVIRYVDALDPIELDNVRWGLVHGDLHFDNILWDGEHISTLLDFEKACYAPLDLELDLFLRYCTFPALFVAEEFEHLTQRADYQLVPAWFKQAYPDLFENAYQRERLGLYSLHYDLSLLQRFPPRNDVAPSEEDHLINRIRSVVEQA